VTQPPSIDGGWVTWVHSSRHTASFQRTGAPHQWSCATLLVLQSNGDFVYKERGTTPLMRSSSPLKRSSVPGGMKVTWVHSSRHTASFQRTGAPHQWSCATLLVNKVSTTMRQPQFRSTATTTGDGGSLGIYSHANSPLRKNIEEIGVDAVG
jgi:hypothetical protein